MISDSFLQELKSRSDIEQIISSYLPLKRHGRTANGLCPFHSEKTPSFCVYLDNQSFFCFGCGAGGDIINFIRRIENLGYVEAVKFLAQRAGMAMPEEVDDGSSRRRTLVLEINRALARFYHENLKQTLGKQALDYLHDRGLNNKTITRFGIGVAPNDWNATENFLKKKDFTEEDMLTAAVVAKGQRGGCYDLFRNRVMFPIIDLRGNVVGFGGRIMEDGKGPKYLNSPDTPVFKKSRNLFALNIAKASKRGELILCEGYMDVISMHQAGFDNAVATLGTALTAEQSRLLSQYVNNVVLSYDSDEAGQTATRRASGMLDEVGMKIRVLSIPNAKDPDEYIKKFGADRFELLLQGSSNAIEFEIARLRKKYDIETSDGKVAFLKEFLQLMLSIQSDVERDVYIGKTATELSVQKSAILSQLELERRRAAKKMKRNREQLKVYSEIKPTSQPHDFQRSQNIKYALAEDKLLAILIKNPDYYSNAQGKIVPKDFITDRNRELAEILFNRLETGQTMDLTLLGSQLSMEQMNTVTGLISAISGMSFSCIDMNEYIKTILSHKQLKSQDEVAAMPDTDLQAYIASLAAKKKYSKGTE